MRTIGDIINELRSSEYDFLRNDPKLGKNVILLGLGGSYAYGTNTDTSDIDIRGVALNQRNEILEANPRFEVFEERNTDTVIYSINKVITLLANCNPNVIEMLGLKPDHYLIKTNLGQLLVENRKAFLSQKAAVTFGGYANSQLRRLENATVQNIPQAQRETHILNSIKGALGELPEGVKVYTDKSEKDDMDEEIFVDMNLKHYPARDCQNILANILNVIRDYQKLGNRNKNAIDHKKLGKHMMHLVRLYYTCLDILEKGDIITYRETEHDLLMDIRNGKYLNENNRMTSDFQDMISELEKRLAYARKNTDLPKEPDYDKIHQIQRHINNCVIDQIV
jgi:predicted nucleotidyltransferase